MPQTRLLLDTNVWMDYFLDRSSLHDIAGGFIAAAFADESLTICTAALSTRDIYYLIRRELKQADLSENGSVSEEVAAAANEIAWACLATMRRLSFIVPVDETDIIEATILRDIHSDFEDNLIAAAAKRINAAYIVTSDRQMLAHQPYPCLEMTNWDRANLSS